MSFRSTIDELKEVEGTGTRLVSLYLPPDKSLQSIVNRLRSEHAEAEQIKSKQTRQGVQRAITIALNELTKYEQTPENGVAIFSGVDKDDVEWSRTIEPPEPIQSFEYRCDSSFYVEPLEEIFHDGTTIGLVIVERRAGTLGRLVGDRIEHIVDMESDAKGKHSAGGFSQGRFERIEQEATDNFYESVAETATDEFDDIEGLIVGGSNISRDEFTDRLPHDMDVIASAPAEHTGEDALDTLVSRTADDIQDVVDTRTRQEVERFLRDIPRGGSVAYGIDETKRAAEMGAIDVLLLDERTEINDEIEEIVNMTNNRGGDVVRVPSRFEAGNRFNTVFNGIGARCRFDIG